MHLLKHAVNASTWTLCRNYCKRRSGCTCACKCLYIYTVQTSYYCMLLYSKQLRIYKCSIYNMLKSKEYRALSCRIKFISLKITKCILPNLIVYPCISPDELHLFDGDALCIELQTMSNSSNTLYWGRRKSYQFMVCLLWELISLSPANPVRSYFIDCV